MTADSALLRALERDGYVVLEDLIDRDRREHIRDESRLLLEKTGANPFEGLKTQRLYRR